MLGKIWRFIASVKLAVVLIGLILTYVLTAFYMAGFMSDSDSVYNSPLFIALLGMLAVNLTACSIRRIKILRKPSDYFPQKFNCLEVPSLDALVLFEEKLRQHRYIIFKTNNSLIAAKNKWSPFGSIFFHLGMVFIIVGFGFTSLFGMNAWIIIPEGTAADIPTDLHYIERGSLYDRLTEYTVGLKDVEIPKERGEIEQVKGQLEFFQGNSRSSQLVEINRPAKFADYYWRSKSWGYTAEITLSDKSGNKIFDNLINIAKHPGNQFYDTFNLPGNLTLQVELFPNEGTGNPKINYVLKKNGIKSGKGEIQLNEETILEEYNMSFNGYRYWEQFDVSYDPGEYLIFFGSFLTVFGLAWRILFIRKRVWIKFENEEGQHKIGWVTKADYFNNIYLEEVDRLFKSIGGKEI